MDNFPRFCFGFQSHANKRTDKKINVQITKYTGLGVLLVRLSIIGKFVTITYVLSFSFLAKRAGVKILLGRSPKPLPPSVPGLLLHF